LKKEILINLKAISGIKSRIDADALIYSDRMHQIGMASMITLWGVLARLTWWEYSWDVMEPCTYFVTYAGAILMYTFYLSTKTSPNYNAVSIHKITNEF
jgi:hypothetical protein